MEKQPTPQSWLETEGEAQIDKRQCRNNKVGRQNMHKREGREVQGLATGSPSRKERGVEGEGLTGRDPRRRFVLSRGRAAGRAASPSPTAPQRSECQDDGLFPLNSGPKGDGARRAFLAVWGSRDDDTIRLTSFGPDVFCPAPVKERSGPKSPKVVAQNRSKGGGGLMGDVDSGLRLEALRSYRALPNVAPTKAMSRNDSEHRLDNPGGKMRSATAAIGQRRVDFAASRYREVERTVQFVPARLTEDETGSRERMMRGRGTHPAAEPFLFLRPRQGECTRKAERAAPSSSAAHPSPPKGNAFIVYQFTGENCDAGEMCLSPFLRVVGGVTEANDVAEGTQAARPISEVEEGGLISVGKRFW
ncbi:hypothetical protein BDK51DRAFT_39863 [Blyttiomyces helicus]|uniref:Uncharacterized protein n=1 Tax=Blyttiomyces helicus TaxID=388810 RepID=A0A4P9W8H6_9FUNG|nr:hypothetical protein BDK51DRAFT_39863 [Blyttiomyces helicus]|eukprot:RKO88831.1 hypothetical protein BDK51DRAFT_39863 [Blyttiomyces helicus]